MLALCVTDSVWGEQGRSEALGSRLVSLIPSGQQRPRTVDSMLMVKHTLCPHHLPGSLHSHAGAQEQGKVGYTGAGQIHSFLQMAEEPRRYFRPP